MTPQLVDLNADGKQDILLTTFEGTVYWIQGSEKGWLSPDYLRDKRGQKICISLFMDFDAKEFAIVDRSTKKYSSNEKHQLTSVTSVDWDDDGDFDLLLGSDSGHLYLCKNEGTADKPAFSTTNDRVFAGDKQLELEDGLSNPKVIDWNKDGLFDIVCGASRKGGVFLFLNVGKQGQPRFTTAKTLIQPTTIVPPPPQDFVYSDASFGSLMNNPERAGYPSRPRQGFFVEVVDYDRDGDLDLLVGGSGCFTKPKARLSVDEAKQLKVLAQKISATQAKIKKLTDQLHPKRYETIIATKSFKQLHREMYHLYTKKIRTENEMLPSKSMDYIWIYPNLSNK